MTIQEFKIKLGEVINPDLTSDIEKETIKLAESGGVDLENENDYAIVKTCLSVALENMSHDLYPLSEEYQRIAKNLRHF